MMRMDHVAFEVSDLERSIDFFKATLGFTEGWRHRNEDEREECVFLSLGDVRLELLVQIDNPISSSTKPKRPYCPHLAIGVDNLNEALDRLNKNDVPLLRGPRAKPAQQPAMGSSQKHRNWRGQGGDPARRLRRYPGW